MTPTTSALATGAPTASFSEAQFSEAQDERDVQIRPSAHGETLGRIEPVYVYFEDLDAMGVVHNGRYVLLIERALESFWTRLG